MRLWSLHPRYLDSRGLVAGWREALLARKVIQGDSRGYRFHPQLQRFKNHSNPSRAIEYYLQVIYTEAVLRQYHFDKTRISTFSRKCPPIPVSSGQINFEWTHLKNKLEKRNPEFYNKLNKLQVKDILPHPLFTIIPGPPASWEKVKKNDSEYFR
jgi:hypothetical protein